MQDADPNRNDLLKLSPFAVQKGITALAGEPKMVKKLPFGLLIEVTSRSHSSNLLRSNEFANLGVKIKVSPHRTLNSIKGIIRCRDISDMAEEDIQNELGDQNVTHVKRIYMDKGTKATNTYIVTFGTTELPASIKIGYLNVRVSPYIPNPLRCYKCQEYGHGASKCARTERCSNCGGNHSNQGCTVEPSCVHCHLKHPTTDRNCPRFLLEKEIQRIKYTEKISFPEARQKAQGLNSTPTYAAVMKKCRSIATQADFSPNYELDTSTTALEQGMAEGIRAFFSSEHPSAQRLKAAMRMISNPSETPKIGEQTGSKPAEKCSQVLLEEMETANEFQPCTTLAQNSQTISLKETAIRPERYLMQYLQGSTKDHSSIRDNMMQRDMKNTCKLLNSHGLNRAYQTLMDRSKMPYDTWPKDKFTSAEELRNSIGNHKFTPDQYHALLVLALHGMYQVAGKLARALRK